MDRMDSNKAMHSFRTLQQCLSSPHRHCCGVAEIMILSHQGTTLAVIDCPLKLDPQQICLANEANRFAPR